MCCWEEKWRICTLVGTCGDHPSTMWDRRTVHGPVRLLAHASTTNQAIVYAQLSMWYHWNSISYNVIVCRNCALRWNNTRWHGVSLWHTASLPPPACGCHSNVPKVATAIFYRNSAILQTEVYMLHCSRIYVSNIKHFSFIKIWIVWCSAVRLFEKAHPMCPFRHNKEVRAARSRMSEIVYKI